ncbi:tail sheath protein [uncultured Caudovirales phage]|uniref:Tail sheath protein n=1 Tax=uncultured Caudovirales phage TaxID=2100421 RepID=A0A6J5L061_9CAUD|nr:tail sheath protein [uncultured Caudovirales phage]
MAYALSPGVTVLEKDYTSIVPSVDASTGAFAGTFPWGPVLQPVLLSSENDLVSQFGKPSASNFESFFTAANFLSYTQSLYVCRQDSANALNGVSNAGTAVKIRNIDHYNTLTTSTYNADWAAKYAGVFGNSLKVSYADSTTFKNTVSGTLTLTSGALAGGTAFLTELFVGAVIRSSAGTVVGTVTAIASNSAATITTDASWIGAPGSGCLATWAYYDQFDSAPSTSSYALSANATNDELHIIVIDEDGVFTGTAGTVLEKFAFVSKASDARKYDGTNNYYKDVINNTSKYIWWMRHTTNVTGTTAWGTAAAGATFKTLLLGTSSISNSSSIAGGVDPETSTDSYVQAAWLLYLDDSQYDIRLLPIGKSTSTTANYIIQNVAEVRKDCLVFVSPQDNAAATPIIGNGSTATTAISTYRSAITSSSFAVMDTGYKYQYDRYNDVYRWVPLNGDIAGLCARTDYTNDAWWSPGGFSRGQIKNVVKLAVNPTKTDRDVLYKNGVNPVVAFPGQGVILYGDKTLLAKPSAFDRIGVRRLFITIEKVIGEASRYQLFEFNDAFTRAQFKNIVEPFLRDVKGRRGITDFKVVCDDTNNAGVVIDSNNFVGDIYIKPNRSINFITLSFIASRTGVDFSVVGA